MSQKGLQPIKVVENAVADRLSVVEAAELRALSQRQVKRLKRARLPAERPPPAREKLAEVVGIVPARP